MKKYLIFRTDRVGDFLFSLKFVEIIKKKDPSSEISIVCSNKNYDYVKTFNYFKDVIILENNISSKIKLIFKLRKYYYDSIIVHDGKNRSRFISFFLKYKKRVVCINNLIDTQLEIIKKTCKKIDLDYDEICLDFLDKREEQNFNIPFSNYILLHFDEKWKYNDYIKKYTNIEPNEDELIEFIENIISKNKKLIVTTGKKSPKILGYIKSKLDPLNVKIFENQSLLEIEKIVFNANLLISCHGWISHIASAKKIKQIDIIYNSYPYGKWTSHFRNYTSLSRTSFSNLAKEILNHF